MDDLSSLLLSVIEETEADARDAGGKSWQTECTCPGAECAGRPECERIEGDDITIYPEGGHDAAQAAHIARHDPSSVLRRCAADRKLVDLHGIVHRNIGWLEWDEGEHAEMYAELPVCGLCVPKHSSFPRREDVPEGPCCTVRILAAGYGLTDH